MRFGLRFCERPAGNEGVICTFSVPGVDPLAGVTASQFPVLVAVVVKLAVAPVETTVTVRTLGRGSPT